GLWARVKGCAGGGRGVGRGGGGPGWLAFPAKARDGGAARVAPARPAAPKEAAARKALAEAAKEAESAEAKEVRLSSKVNLLVHIAQAQHWSGDKGGAAKTFALALAAAKEAARDFERRYAYSRVAEAQAEVGDIKGALATLAADKSGMGRAGRATDLLATPRNEALKAIAVAQVRAGDLKGAVKTVEEITDARGGTSPRPNPQAEAWRAVAVEQARA